MVPLLLDAHLQALTQGSSQSAHFSLYRLVYSSDAVGEVEATRLVTAPTDAERPSLPYCERVPANLNGRLDGLGDFANSVSSFDEVVHKAHFELDNPRHSVFVRERHTSTAPLPVLSAH